MVQLCKHIDDRESLSPNQKHYLLFTFLPSFTIRILRATVLDEVLTSHFVNFFKRVVEIALDEIPKQSPLYDDLLVVVLDPTTKFYHSSLAFSPEDKDDKESYAQFPKHSFRSKNKSYYDIIDHLGRIKGFERMLNQMSSPDCPISVLASYLTSIKNMRSHDYINTVKYETIVKQIMSDVIPVIREMSVEQLKTSKKSDYEVMLKSLTDILQKSEMHSDEGSEIVEKLYLDLAIKCLKSGSLEKRLNALSQACSIIQGLEKDHSAYPKWITKSYMLTWLVDNDIVDNVFGESNHIHLIKNSKRIIQFLAENDKLDDQSLNLIWACAMNPHESLSKETFTLISEIYQSLKKEFKEILLSNIKLLPIPQYSQNIVQHLLEMIKVSDNNEYLEMLWFVFTSEEASDEIVKCAYLSIIALINSALFSVHRDSITMKILNLIRNEKNTDKVMAYNLLRTTIVVITQSKESVHFRKMIKNIEEKIQFLQFLLNEFASFKSKCKEMLSNIPVSEDKDDFLKNNPFPYKSDYIEEIKCRFHLIYSLLTSLDLQIDEKRLVNQIWDLFYVNSISEEEKVECILWFNALQYKPQNAISSFSKSIIPYIFENFISKIDPNIMTTTIYNCFHKFFFESNALLKNISWGNENDKNDISVDVHPSKLLGEQDLWSIQLICPHQEVVDLAIELLNNIYDKVSPQFKDDMKGYYLTRCLDFMATSAIELKSSDEKSSNLLKMQVKRSLASILKLLEKYKSDTCNSILITRGNPITLKIKLLYSLENEIKEYNTVIETHSTDIVSQVVEKIITCCQQFLEQLNLDIGQLVFSPDLESSSGKLIQDLNLNDLDQITIQRNNTYDERLTYLKSRKISRYNISKPQTREEAINKLIEYTGVTKKEALRALEKWDGQYERALSNLIDEDNKAKFLEECKKYIDYTKEPSEVIQSIKSRYEELFSDSNESKKGSDHPISILSSNENFSKIFDILTVHDSDIIESAWNIIKMLPVSRIVKDSLIKTESVPDWETLLPNDTFRLLYTLRVMEQILFPHNVATFDDRVSLIKKQFIETKGLTRLMNLFPTFITPSDEYSESDSTINYKEQVMALSLKIFDMYFDDELLESSIVDSLKNLLSNIFKNILQSRNSEIILYTLRIAHKLLSKGATLVELLPDFENNIINLLLQCEYQEVRRNAVNQVYRISQSSNILRDTLLECMIKQLPKNSEDFFYEQYFWLFEKILEMKLENMTDKSLFSDIIANLISYSVDIITNRKVYEVNIHTSTDWILYGAMNILSTIYKYCPEQEFNLPLIEYLFNNGLFTIKKIDDNHFPKCKTTRTRSACYNLLIQLAKLNETNYRYLLGLLMSSQPKTYYEAKSWKYHPGNDDKSSVGYVGIANIGETCYMNSLLQQFYMMPELRKDILKLQPDLNENNIVVQLQKMFGYLQESEKMMYNPIEFCKVYLGSDSNFEDQQQDVNEFFNFLCQRVESQLEGTKDEKIFHKHFVGKLSNEIRSVDPNITFVSEREEDFYIIPLDIKSRDNMKGALDLFTQKEMLQGDNQYYYEELDTKVNATRRCSFKVLPDTLVFQLLRFDYDMNSNKRKKLDNYFNFPNLIDMKPWTTEGLRAKESGQNLESDESYLYSLCGIIVHMGYAENGHYYSIIKERQSPYRWLQFNDHSVTEYNFEKVSEDCFGGVSTSLLWDPWRGKYVRKEIFNDKNAYMLFYERVKVNKEAPMLQTDVPVEANEFQLIDNVPKYVYDTVWEENATYLRDRLIFDPLYSNFLLNFTNLKFESKSDISIFETYHHTIHNGLRFVVEYLSHAKENTSISRWFNLLSLCYSNSVSSCLSFIDYAKENNVIRTVLLECPHEQIRIEFGLLLVTIFKTLIKNNVAYGTIEGDKKVSAEYVLFKMLFDLIEVSRPNWKHFKQYFAVIRDYALLGTEQRRMLLNFNIIEEYRDYFAGYRTKDKKPRASVMDNSNLPDMVEFHDTLSIVLRGCKINGKVPPTCLEGDLIDIPESLIDPLLMKEFLQSFLQMDYNVKAVSELIAYISYCSPRINSIVMDTLVELFEKYEVKLHIIEKHMESMILMEDEEDNIKNRIMDYILSGKKSDNSQKTSSLLKIAKSTPKPQSILDFILYLASKSKMLFDILSSSRDIFYIIDAYESLIEDKYNDFFVDVAILENDLSKGYYQLFLKDDIPSEMEGFDKWRVSREYFGFLYANYIAQKNSNSSFNEYLIMHQSRQIESLKAELLAIKNAKTEIEEKKMKLGSHVSILLKLAKRYKNSNIDIPPNIQEIYNEIDFTLEQDDTNFEGDEISENYEVDDDYINSQYNVTENKELEVINPEFDEEIELMEAPIGYSFARIEDNKLCLYTIKKPVITPEMVYERLQALRAMFPDIEEELLIEVLKANGFNAEEAANDLMDEERMAYIRAFLRD